MSKINADAYELVKEQWAEEIKSQVYLLKHKKTGARVLVLSNDDDNKVFSISFRTPPHDDTGLPHIMEHSVLCGSKAFPAKDPFVELAKGSLNTFLNAMTFPDKTMYPIASCNDKDFKNLMHVYMDAVFYPNIYSREEIFKQEGWSYKLEKPEDALQYNGVVYNEMKGAFSSPDGLLERMILHSLFGDTCYGYESGGDPAAIPSLTYEDFIAFHKKYYHPSNSYIYLYGDMDVEERLTWLDSEYLAGFESAQVDSSIKLQKAFDGLKEESLEYPISEDEEEEDNTYLSYNVVIDTCLNKENYYALQVIDYALFDMPGAPVKQALIDAEIGKDVSSLFENGIYQPYFAVTAKYANVSDKERFVSVLTEALKKVVKDGIDEKTLIAGINSLEFKSREADFGSYPKGLIYGMQAMDSWLYDDNEPVMHILARDTFKVLKEKIGTDYYVNLVQKYFLDNKHASLVTLIPSKGLTIKQDKELADKLAAYKSSLSEEQIKKLSEDYSALKAYQEAPELEENLLKIPLLERSDIKKEPAPIKNDERELGGALEVWHDYFTNGINYIDLFFDMTGVSEKLLPYVGFFRATCGLMDTENYSYQELAAEIDIHTGGLGVDTSIYSIESQSEQFEIKAEFRTKALYEETERAVELLREVLFRTKFDDDKRLKELVSMVKSRLQSTLMSSAHAAAAGRASSYYSERAAVKEVMDGISFFKFVEEIDKDFDSRKDELKKALYEIRETFLHKSGLIISITADEEGRMLAEKPLLTLVNELPVTPKAEGRVHVECTKKNEGFKNSAMVQYVARCGNFKKGGYEYTGALNVLRTIMSYEYLWLNVRVMGGAYGCMNSFARTGDAYFVSYRDPNLKKTNEVFDRIPEYLENFEISERDMTKYVIGTMSTVDQPLTPQQKGSRDISHYIIKTKFADIEKSRREMLTASVEDIRALAPYVKEILAQNNLCAIGNEGKIAEEAEIFDTVVNLFN